MGETGTGEGKKGTSMNLGVARVHWSYRGITGRPVATSTTKERRPELLAMAKSTQRAWGEPRMGDSELGSHQRPLVGTVRAEEGDEGGTLPGHALMA